MSPSLSYITPFLLPFFFPLEKGPRGEKGSPGEAVIETIRTEVSSLAAQSKWPCLSTPLLGDVSESQGLLTATRRCP